MSQFGNKKKLYRNRENKMVGGVCSGIADYLELNVGLVRIVMVVTLFMTAQVAFIGYWIAFFILDNNPKTLTDASGNLQSSFNNAYQRKSVLNSVRDRYEKIEERLRNIEAYVTSPRHKLRDEIDSL